LWRDLYPALELDTLAEVVRVAAQHCVALAYGLSPGLSIRYHDACDIDRIIAKYIQVADLGVRHFHLLLDDIPAKLRHPADRAAYPDLVSAHVELVNQVRRRLDDVDPRLHLAVCPTYYHGRGDEPYISELGARTDPRVDLFWTGRAVWSSELDLADAATFMRSTSRPVLYWDNYPVNDLAMATELHLGAYRGRDPHLYRFSRGVVANAMGLPESSKIALATVAEYLWDPEGYDPDRSWASAIMEVAGARDAAAVRLFADNVRTSCLEESDSPLLAAALQDLEFETEFGDPTAGRSALADLVGRFADAAAQLLGPDVDNPALAAELRPWLEVFGRGSRRLLDLLGGARGVASGDRDACPPAVFGDVLEMFAGPLGRRD
jgi:hyaluronoglucosaminidase